MATARLIDVSMPPPPAQYEVELRLTMPEAVMLRRLLGACSGQGPAYRLSYNLFKDLADIVARDMSIEIQGNPNIFGG
jgi:hypothetical protein